ncbi:MAG TPA: DUF368 domain-containing protein [Candidatus Hungatella pullicola]|nr:DUF368 domain-containing protein [Candidatus Hungatella pullicola]
MSCMGQMLKGMVIGVANILPGISGGMLAISMGVYDTIIHGVTHLFREPGKSIKILFPYGLGAAAGILLLSFAFESLFHAYPLQTKMTFLGLIFGGIPALAARVKPSGFSQWWRGKALTWITCIAVVGFTVWARKKLGTEPGGQNIELAGAFLGSPSLWWLRMVLIGLLAAGTMIVPGVSGSMIMMMLGVYEPLLEATNDFFRAAASFNGNRILVTGLLLAPYFLGLVTGVFVFAGWVERLLSTRERTLTCVIMGLVYSSPIVILWDTPWRQISLYQFLGGLSLCLLGYVCSSALGGEG